MVVTRSGRRTNVSELQPVKALVPIVVRAAGSLMSRSELHPQNAPLPMAVTDAGIQSSVRASQCMKAPAGKVAQLVIWKTEGSRGDGLESGLRRSRTYRASQCMTAPAGRVTRSSGSRKAGAFTRSSMPLHDRPGSRQRFTAARNATLSSCRAAARHRRRKLRRNCRAHEGHQAARPRP